ncbi:MAG: DUF3179 domain-containing (seleno)protein [Thermoleophilaceae bacterium]
MRPTVAAIVAALILAGCGAGADDEREPAAYPFPEAPAPADGPLAPAVEAALGALVRSAVAGGGLDGQALAAVAASGDARLAWLVSDLLRFVQAREPEKRLVAAFESLTGVDPRADPSFPESAWRSVTNHLIAWDTPAPPGYRERKAELYLAVEPGWEPFFADAGSDIDWRLVSWGGVLIDDRRLGDDEPCPRGCIPALDDPGLTGAEDGGWYPDERIVFGVVVGGEPVAFPRNIMEVHEMVNLTVGGRRLGIPYCTLCGSAQAYLTDSVPAGLATPLLRTSGLLSRSNKLMYDLETGSALDTFTGRALSGPLHDRRVVLEQTTVETATWGEWKAAHPGTRIVAEDGGIGREYELDPLGGRDDDGPIFPVGDVDPRLPVQAQVVGVIAPGGGPVAFPADQARAALAGGEPVVLGEVELVAGGGGLRARTPDGEPLAAHQSFWFAWSQFHPGTDVWSPLGARRPAG